MWNTVEQHNHYSFQAGNYKRRSSCCSHCNSSSDSIEVLDPLESRTMSLTPPLENVYYETDQYEPFTCIYLLNLFLVPDMETYLKETPMSDDIYALPVHLQKLVCEARMEVIMLNNDNKEALKRLENVRRYVHTVAGKDTEAVISTLNELVKDEDELSNILGE